MRALDPYIMQGGGVGGGKKLNAEGGREAKKFKNHWARGSEDGTFARVPRPKGKRSCKC